MKKKELNKMVKDSYDNVYYLKEELSRGGQGVVYRTNDPDLAIKQPLDNFGNPDTSIDKKIIFERIILLPLPKRIPVTLPISVLTDNTPGYVMRLLEGMKPLASFMLDSKTKEELRKGDIPDWISDFYQKDPDSALGLLYFGVKCGGIRKHYHALFKTAAILARLHLAGIVYGDVSLYNIYVLNDRDYPVWLIDSDNLCFDKPIGGKHVFTPGLGAPEVVLMKDGAHPASDAWAFAVMAYQLLVHNHPFDGSKLEDKGGDDWDSDTVENVSEEYQRHMEQKEYAIYFPYIDDINDDSNSTKKGYSRSLVLTKEIADLFQTTFGEGRLKPLCRPTMAVWALALARTYDQILECPSCKMTYFDYFDSCPFCESEKPAYFKLSTKYWSMDVQLNEDLEKLPLPHRLFYPFSYEKCDESVCNVIGNNVNGTLRIERGEEFPCDVKIEFVGAKK